MGKEMSVQCRVCSDLGFFCMGKSLSAETRTVVTVRNHGVIAKIGPGIGMCEVESLEATTLSEDTSDHDEPELESELQYEKLIPLIYALHDADRITGGDLHKVETYNSGRFFVPAMLALLRRVVSCVDRELLDSRYKSKSDQRGEDAVRFIQTALTSPELQTLFDTNNQGIQVTGVEEDSFGGDLSGFLTAEARQYFAGQERVRIQSKSRDDKVLLFLQDLHEKCIKTKNPCYLERDPNKTPLVVLNGHDLDLTMKARLGFQMAANVIIQNQVLYPEHTFNITKDFIDFLPPEIIVYMYHLATETPTSSKLPSFMQEMNELLAISDRFRKTSEPTIDVAKQLDPRASVIVDSVLRKGDEYSRKSNWPYAGGWSQVQM